MSDKSPIEFAALDWARARIRLKNSETSLVPDILEAYEKERKAHEKLYALCVQELARLEGTIIDLRQARAELPEGAHR